MPRSHANYGYSRDSRTQACDPWGVRTGGTPYECGGHMHTGGPQVLCDVLGKGSQEPVRVPYGFRKICTWVHRMDRACTVRAWEDPYNHSCVAGTGSRLGLVRVQ